jgi:D-alanine-D-alanine ligase
MKKASILLLYSLPLPHFPDGTPDLIGRKSSLSRLRDVEAALRNSGYRVVVMELRTSWSTIARKVTKERVDLIFNLCEEFLGQTSMEMNIAAMLDFFRLPYTGSPALILGLTQDKGTTKRILFSRGIPTPSYLVVSPGEKIGPLPLRFPLMVKPVKEDGSLGITEKAFVGNRQALVRQVEEIHRLYSQPALLEEYIEGRELNVSIIGNEAPQVLPISEIDFSKMPRGIPQICSYAAKWVEESPEFNNTPGRCPAPLPSKIRREVERVSLDTYKVTGCRDYARVDIRLSSEGIPFVLEVNANPDISQDAGMVRSARAAGFSYEGFITQIVKIALARGRPQSASVQRR